MAILTRTAASTAFTKPHVTVVSIGTDDYINLFKDCEIRFEIVTATQAAAKDDYEISQALRRRVTITVRKLVETGGQQFLALASGTASATCSFTIGGKSYSGAFMVQDAGLTAGEDAGIDESITLINNGAVSVA
jgi:hypothetical protein